jgi:hypothetical protein
MTETVQAFRPRNSPARGAWRPDSRLATDRVYVLFTSIEETLRAVKEASRLARTFGSRLTVIHLRPVAFGAPLEAPSGVSPVETEEFRARLEAEDCDTEVKVCLCRDARGAVPALLDRPSVVVVGRHRRWWPTRADRWRRTLEAAGHFVVVVDGDANA